MKTINTIETRINGCCVGSGRLFIQTCPVRQGPDDVEPMWFEYANLPEDNSIDLTSLRKKKLRITVEIEE